MNKSIYNLATVAALALGVVSSNVYADDDDLQEIAAVSKEFGLITLEAAQAKALAAKPGVVTDADLENRKLGKGWDYEFEIVDSDGKEWEVNIDAKTGKVNGIHRDWF